MQFFRSIAVRLTKPRYYISILLLVGILAAIGYAMSGEGEPMYESEVVERAQISQVITKTGEVKPAEEVSLSFARTGRVAHIAVQEGSSVTRGQTLARLSTGALSAELAQTRADLRSQEARLEELRASFDDTQEDQRAGLEDQREDFLNNDLQAYAGHSGNITESSSYSFDPPTISGVYTGNETGEYRITLYPSSADSGYSFRYSGLESGVGSVSTQTVQPLGEKGLYIEFPDDFARSRNIEWVVPIPNTRSVTYLTAKNAYEDAQRSLSQVDADRAAIRAQEAAVERARASIDSTRSKIADATITSPVNGRVTSLDLSVGETVSGGTPVISVISDAAYFVEAFIPEADIANLDVGDTATVTLDAYDGVEFPARVSSVNSSAADVEGVPSFKTKIEFIEQDARIRAGLSADAAISAAEKVDVLTVPGRALFARGGEQYVRVVAPDGTLEERKVTTSLRGSDGRVEITSGLEEGDEVVTFLSEELREQISI